MKTLLLSKIITRLLILCVALCMLGSLTACEQTTVDPSRSEPELVHINHALPKVAAPTSITASEDQPAIEPQPRQVKEI